jgi:hypothetical protein
MDSEQERIAKRPNSPTTPEPNRVATSAEPSRRSEKNGGAVALTNNGSRLVEPADRFGLGGVFRLGRLGLG